MLKENKTELKSGIYRHYKGGRYKLIGQAWDSVDEKSLVVYQSIEDDKIWVRALDEFLAEVEVDNQKKSRFTYEEPIEPDDWQNKYLRALADYQNLLKQTARDKDEFYQYALANFLHELLPVYNNLKASVANLSPEEQKNPWVEGVKYVLKQFKEVLESKGLEEIRVMGEKFDPETMEAISGQGDIVQKEIGSGYKLKGKVIIPAKVVVE